MKMDMGSHRREDSGSQIHPGVEFHDSGKGSTFVGVGSSHGPIPDEADESHGPVFGSAPRGFTGSRNICTGCTPVGFESCIRIQAGFMVRPDPGILETAEVHGPEPPLQRCRGPEFRSRRRRQLGDGWMLLWDASRGQRESWEENLIHTGRAASLIHLKHTSKESNSPEDSSGEPHEFHLYSTCYIIKGWDESCLLRICCLPRCHERSSHS
ncbi:hypothetical protein Dimus_035735 [Dionaea muscipula]